MPHQIAGIVALQIGIATLVIAAGYLIARKKLIGAELARGLSRVVVDVALPSMAFAQVLRTTDAETLSREWYVPLIGAGLLLIAAIVGVLVARFVDHPKSRRTAAFLVATPNWIYLPLPIATALLGETGIRIVLLMNVGAQLVLWTVGVWLLEHRLDLRRSLAAVASNLGLWSTILAVVIAVLLPSARRLATETGAGASSAADIAALIGAVIVQALAMIGSLTVPLALVVTGVYLADDVQSTPRNPRDGLWISTISRLIIAPLITAALLFALRRYLDADVRRVALLIALMPAAISCGMFAERFGGDTTLASRSILLTTLLALVTVPLLFFILPL